MNLGSLRNDNTTNQLLDWLKNNRAARAARFLVQFFDVVCQTTSLIPEVISDTNFTFTCFFASVIKYISATYLRVLWPTLAVLLSFLKDFFRNCLSSDC